MNMLRQIFLFSCVLFLASCGGGSSNGGGNSSNAEVVNNAAGSWLTFDPARIDIVAYGGDSLAVNVIGTATKTFSKTANIAIIDTVGVVTPYTSIAAISQTQYRVTLNSNPNLKPGVYTSNIQVRVCEDDPRVCNTPFPGSPWTLPFKLTVKSKAAETPVTLTSTPSSLYLTYYEGETKQFSISAESQGDSGKAMNIGVFDSAHNSTLKSSSQVSSKKTIATFETSPALKAGVYTSTLEVRVCADDPIQCQWPYSGSPYKLTLKISVLPNTNFTTLKVLPQVGAWSTFQGNASHTAYVPASFVPRNFLRRWNWTSSGGYLSDVSIENGVVFLNQTSAVYPSGNYELIALSENSGEALWRTSMGILSKANPPAVGSGKVFVTSTGHQDTFFWVFDQANGSLLNKITMSSQWENYLAPTIYGNEVFTESGYYGGMSKYGIGEQKILWWVSLPQYDSWSPAVDAKFAYSYLSGSLYAVSKVDGQLAFKITNPDFSWSGYGGVTPVLSEKNMAYLVGNGLQAFDLVKQTRPWSVTGSIYGSPAYAKDVIYVLNANGTVLEARSASNGSLLWMTSALTSDYLSRSFSYIVVTDNLAFISSANNTLAIDLNTHQVVWEYPYGGSLAISDRGVLYIRGTTRLDAINLQ